VASNSIRATVEAMMHRAHLSKYLDVTLSNEDVERPKPAPDIYIAAMLKLGVSPSETLIVEDNEHGLQAARASGAHVLVVRDVNDVNLANIDRRIEVALKEAA
jgi:HAD superfamily hydrolase (TIGR01509 family)